MRHVIIGNGIAGITASETIRRFDAAFFTLVALETFPPYSRPMISMLVEGSTEAADMVLKEEHFYERFHIDARIGHRAEEGIIDQGLA